VPELPGGDRLFGPVILLFHYSGHALDTLLAGHVRPALLFRRPGAPDRRRAEIRPA